MAVEAQITAVRDALLALQRGELSRDAWLWLAGEVADLLTELLTPRRNDGD